VTRGRTVRKVEHADEVEALIVRGARAPAINLLQGVYAVGGNDNAGDLKRWRRAAVLAAVLAASPLILWGAQIIIDRSAAASADRQAAAIADRLAPAAAADRAPEQRLALRLAELDQGERFLSAVAALYAVIEKTPGSAVTNLFYGSNGQIRATVAHANYSDAQSMKAEAALYGFSLVEDATSTEGGRVMTDIVLEAAP
jgi:general secretion pathway protein L